MHSFPQYTLPVVAKTSQMVANRVEVAYYAAMQHCFHSIQVLLSLVGMLTMFSDVTGDSGGDDSDYYGYVNVLHFNRGKESIES